MTKPRIVISLGDPGGIGPEIILRALDKPVIRKSAEFLVCGHASVLRKAANAVGLAPDLEVVKPAGNMFGGGAAIRILEPCPLGGAAPAFGKWTERTGRLSLAYVQAALELCLENKADALVTAPICKAAWKLAGSHYPGHTELLADVTGTKKFVMLLAGKGLRVALVTIHEPLAKVPRLVTARKIIDTAVVLHHALINDFGIANPRLCVLGLNPHAGESGHIGSEEKLVIEPAVKKLRKMKIAAIGPVPADTAFHHALRGEYDAVVAMYHDQGLGPLKTVAFDCGVNITLGLPIVRTSVDHGTAFDLAGKGEANSLSCEEAIRAAVEISRRRKA
jgi:4-hydroxythreonine-4-phosphate dehydrogenase